MRTILIIFVLVATVILGTKSTFTDRKCTAPGLRCKTCSTVKLCTRSNETKFQEEILGTCPKFSTCLNGQCVTKENPICMRIFDTFNCQEIGIFPDPYNCQMYHRCTADGDKIKVESITCLDEFAYYPLSHSCSTYLPNNQCHYTPVPLCLTLGQHGTVEGDKNIYFICKSNGYDAIVPYLYKCPKNQFYDGNYGCK